MGILTTTVKPKTTQSLGQWVSVRWIDIFLVVYGLWVFLPFLAPIFMQAGWSGAGRVIYFIYSFFCHQLPERSFFFFGQKTMYSMSEIQSAWQKTFNPLILRQFIGNPQLGWKVAWSDRMISFYTTIWLFVLVWRPFRHKVKPLPWWAFVLLLLPIALDGGTHFLSDLAGIEQGFRENNQWLAVLTNHIFPASFYAGNALGSFNSWMRLITGPLAGIGIGWFAFPTIFQAQTLNQELDQLNYGKVLEKIKNEYPRSSR